MGNLSELIEQYKEAEHSFIRRIDAVREIGKLGSHDAVDALKTALADKEHLVQKEAIRALSQIDSPETVPLLMKTLASPDESLQQFAAESLGDLAAIEAKSALEKLAANGPIFVRSVADRALEKIAWEEKQSPQSTTKTSSTPVAPPPAIAVSATVDPVSKIRDAVAGTNFQLTIDPSGRKHTIVVPLPDNRKQTVFVITSGRDGDGASLICVYTLCGPATSDNYELALKYNMKIAFGALAINQHNNQKMFVMVDAMLNDSTDTTELRKSIASVAKHGDRVENDLTGKDVH